jgi:hypothetical protein
MWKDLLWLFLLGALFVFVEVYNNDNIIYFIN